jgi:hypothetical protein
MKNQKKDKNFSFCYLFFISNQRSYFVKIPFDKKSYNDDDTSSMLETDKELVIAYSLNKIKETSFI